MPVQTRAQEKAQAPAPTQQDNNNENKNAEGPVAPEKKAAEDKPADQAILCFLTAIGTQANAAGVFVICLVGTLAGGGYRTELICPITGYLRVFANLASPVLYQSNKSWFSDACDEEDVIWRFFYDTWPKSLVTNTDSLPQLFLGIFAFWGLRSTHLLVIIYLVSGIYALIATLLLNLQLMIEWCVRHSAGQSSSAKILDALAWVVWAVNLPMHLLHTRLMEPLGRFVCNVPPRILRGLRIRVPDPLFIFYFLALDKPEEDPPIRVSRRCPCDCSAPLIWYHFKQAGGACVKWFISLFLLNTLLRLICIITSIGPVLVWIVGLLTLRPTAFYQREFEYYKLLTYGGFADKAFGDVFTALQHKLTALFTFAPLTWLFLIALVGASIAAQKWMPGKGPRGTSVFDNETAQQNNEN